MIHHLIHTEIQIWTETGHFYLRRMKINNSDGLPNKNWAQICCCEGCHLCSAGRGCKTRLQLYCFKGFPLISMCTVMTKRAQSDSLWPKSLGRTGAKSIFVPARLSRMRTCTQKRPFVTKKCYISLQDALWNPKKKEIKLLRLSCLIVFVWEELNLFRVTHLSQEELFLPMLVVYVGFKGSKIMWDCRRGELFKRHEISLDGLKSSLFTAHNGGRGGRVIASKAHPLNLNLQDSSPITHGKKRTLPHKKGWDTSPSVQTMH